MDIVLTSCSVYQEFLARSLTDKYSTLSSQMDKVIDDANNEISNLRGKLDSEQNEPSFYDVPSNVSQTYSSDRKSLRRRTKISPGIFAKNPRSIRGCRTSFNCSNSSN